MQQTSELEFENWSDFVQCVSGSGLVGWIYRGLSNYAYNPISKLERILRDRSIPLEGGLAQDEENRAIGFFKRRARLALRSTPSDSDILGWLSLMQHYGAPTRLTDWSVSPFVACYFAYERASLEQDAALWMLNANLCRHQYGYPEVGPLAGPIDHIGNIPCLRYEGGNETKVYQYDSLSIDRRAEIETSFIRKSIENQSDWPLPLPILQPDNRMAAQQACFVCLGKFGVDMHDFLHAEMSYPRIQSDGSMGSYSVPILKKIRLRKEWRDEALAGLARFNVTSDTLFPGLDGIGKATEVFVSRKIELSFWDHLAL